MDILRSGMVCGNLVAALDAQQVNTDQLLLEAKTLVEIGELSPSREVMEDSLETFAKEAQMVRRWLIKSQVDKAQVNKLKNPNSGSTATVL